jgi:hypothetical protein
VNEAGELQGSLDPGVLYGSLRPWLGKDEHLIKEAAPQRRQVYRANVQDCRKIFTARLIYNTGAAANATDKSNAMYHFERQKCKKG